MSSEAPHDVDDEQDEDGEDEDAGEGFVDDDLFGHDRSMPMTAPGPAHIAETSALVRETRFRWEPIDPEAPEGWRHCDFGHFSEDNERWFSLYTNAPRDKNPHSYETYWRAHRKVVQERWVSPWQDVEAAQNDGLEES